MLGRKKSIKKKKILIVDDEIDFAKTVKMGLERMREYEIKTESNAINAFSTAQDFKPDLVILDVMMPNVDGGDIARQIKADENLKDTPIIFLTAAVTKNEADIVDEKTGDHPLLAKPVALTELINCVKAVLQE